MDEPIEQFAAAARCSAIKSERELVEVVVQMRGPDRSLIGTHQPALQKRRHQVRQFQLIRRDHLASTAYLGNLGIALEVVGDDQTARLNRRGEKGVQVHRLPVRHVAQADAAHPAATALRMSATTLARSRPATLAMTTIFRCTFSRVM